MVDRDCGDFQCDLAKSPERSFGELDVRLKLNVVDFATRAKATMVARGCGQREGIDLF